MVYRLEMEAGKKAHRTLKIPPERIEDQDSWALKKFYLHLIRSFYHILYGLFGVS